MTGLWILGQFGLGLEFLGALLIVRAAYRHRRQVDKVGSDWEGIGHINDLKVAIQSQAITELRGFLLLGVGLALQFASGFNLFMDA